MSVVYDVMPFESVDEQYSTIPFEDHYQVFKEAERKLIEHLAKIGPEEFLIGLRVGYDFADSANEPGIFPYVIEFGHLPPQESLDPARLTMEPDAAAWEKGAGKWLPLAFLEELYRSVNVDLRELARPARIKVGITISIYGAAPTSWGEIIVAPRFPNIHTVVMSCGCLGQSKVAIKDSKTGRSKCGSYCSSH